jgi:hypothetical protein
VDPVTQLEKTMSAQPRITAVRLQETMRYDPITGIFTNLIDRGKKAKEGNVVGFLEPSGYLQTRIDNRTYRLHQLAWLYMWGQWPEGIIDHKNGDKTDNHFKNLRDTTHKVNNQNKRKATSCNQLGILGVSPVSSSGKFLAQIKYGGKQRRLGEFVTPEQASAVYLSAKRQYHEGNTL